MIRWFESSLPIQTFMGRKSKQQLTFEAALTKILSVSKEEINRRIAADKAARSAAYKAGRKKKPGPKRVPWQWGVP